MSTDVVSSKGTVATRARLSRPWIALGVYLGFTLCFLAANAMMAYAEATGRVAALEPIAGMLLGLLAFPVFAIGLPLWLARRWGLTVSFWPKGRRWVGGLVVIVAYLLITQERGIVQLLNAGIPAWDFTLHTLSASLFHISYAPLFGALILPAWREKIGPLPAVLLCAALFALFHLAGFYYFPAGLTLRMQGLLLIAYAIDMLLYLWSRSLILVALLHTFSGAIGLAVNGTLFNQVDEMLIVTAVLMAGLFTYMIAYEIRHRDRDRDEGFWLKVRFD